MTDIRAAYVHVPFCRHRCGYCDFTLVAGRDDLLERYLAGLDREIALSRRTASLEHLQIKTLFFGGGTPTHPPVEFLERMFRTVTSQLTLAADAEISVEANPLDLTDKKIAGLVRCGVNRISLGVQSLDVNVLTLLERDHRPADLQSLMPRLRNCIPNISLDLIFGVPGQSLESWRDMVRQAIAWEPRHISTYGLTWEEGTAFYTRRKRGEMHAVDDSLERDQYQLAMEELAAAGYEHYEISNFAQPGFRCRHNLVYWRGEEYLAYGPGAARYVAGRRETNVRSVLGWLERLERGDSPVAESETLDPAHGARELIYLGLRMIEGIDRHDFLHRTNDDLLEFSAAAIAATVAHGWIEVTPTHVRLTAQGRFLADRVVTEFL